MLDFEKIQLFQDQIRKDNDAQYERAIAAGCLDAGANSTLMNRGEYVYSINFSHNGECEMHIQDELMLTVLGDAMPKVNPIDPFEKQLFQHNGLNAVFHRFRYENKVFVKVLYPALNLTLTAIFSRDDLLRTLEAVPYNYAPEQLQRRTSEELFDLTRGGEI